MGSVIVSMLVTTKVDDLNSEVERVNVIINLTRALYNTNEYEEFKLTSGSYKVINDGRYSLNNIIKIKVVASENRESAAPKLGIKGVEK